MTLALIIAAGVFTYIVMGMTAGRILATKIDDDDAVILGGVLWPLVLVGVLAYGLSGHLFQAVDGATRVANRKRRQDERESRELQRATHRAEMAELETRRVQALEASSGILERKPTLDLA